MSKFKSYTRQEQYIFPYSLEDFIPEGHLSRVVDEIVDGFDTSSIERKYSDLGQKSYHPKLLLKLLFYGYCTGIRSGRKLATKCESDTAYMFLACMHRPDFRTINDFRKDNIKLFEHLFLEVLKICKRLGMVKVGELYVDGTKILANASKKRTKSKQDYEEWQSRLEEEIRGVLKEAEETDAKEDALYGKSRGDELPKGLRKKVALREKIKSVIREMADDERINLSDRDAKNIKGNGLIKPNYNCQTGVTENGIIVAGYVTNNASDSGELMDVVDEAELNAGETFNEILADSGYGTYDSYEKMETRGKTAYVADQAYSKERKQKYKNRLHGYEKSDFIYDKERDEYQCPQGKRLAYKGKDQEDNRHYRVYRGLSCNGCEIKHLCTKGKARIVKREDREEVRERAIERLKSDEGKAKYTKRAYTIEPVFGNLKHNLNYTRFHLRGLCKVNGEFALMCLASNIQKINKLIVKLNKAA
jgi:transposase